MSLTKDQIDDLRADLKYISGYALELERTAYYSPHAIGRGAALGAAARMAELSARVDRVLKAHTKETT